MILICLIYMMKKNHKYLEKALEILKIADIEI